MEKSYWEQENRKVGDWTTQKRRRMKLLIQNAVKDIVESHDIKTVLDLGCGSGLYFPLYDELGLTVDAVDYSEVRLEYAKRMIDVAELKGINVRCLDIFSITDFGKHDCVMLSFVLEHLESQKVTWLIDKIKDSARYFIVVGYYSEPFKDLVEKHKKLCQRLGVPFNTHNEKKGITCAVYDYPTLFNMPYKLHQFGDDCSLLLFENVKAESKPS